MFPEHVFVSWEYDAKINFIQKMLRYFIFVVSKTWLDQTFVCEASDREWMSESMCRDLLGENYKENPENGQHQTRQISGVANNLQRQS